MRSTAGRLGLAAVVWAVLTAAPQIAAGAPAAIYRGVSYGPSAGELATIYASKSPGSPTIVLVHGGGWRLQRLATEAGSQAKALQLQGFTVFDVNYDQDSPTQPAFPLETGEVAAATEWAAAHAPTYNADPQKIVLLGGSAGAQLAAVAAEQLDAAAPGTVRAVISLSGPMNMVTLAEEAADGRVRSKPYVISIGQALGCAGMLTTCSAAYAQEFSPALNVPSTGCPDWLLFASRVDETAVVQAEGMLAALQSAQCSVALEVVPSGHGFSTWSEVSHRIYEFVRAE